MTQQKIGLTLRRFVDELPEDVDRAFVPEVLSQRMLDDKIRVYVPKPKGTILFEDGFPHSGPLFMHSTMPMPFKTERARKEIAEAKLRGEVIDYGMEVADIEFLELHSDDVSKLVLSKEVRVHWFRGAVLLRTQSTGIPGLTPTRSNLRCLRPRNDAEELAKRRDWGGALKEEARYSYPFTIHDLYIDEADSALLRVILEKPEYRDDPYKLYDSALAVYWAYQAAKKFHLAVLNKTKGRSDIELWLTARRPKSPYSTAYVAQQISRLLDPTCHYGRGDPGFKPFDAATLTDEDFRKKYLCREFVGKGLAMILATTHWYIELKLAHPAHGDEEQEELHKVLLAAINRCGGFNGKDQLKALVKIISWEPKAKKKTPSVKKPPPLRQQKMKS